MPGTLLNDVQLAALLVAHPHWSRVGDWLVRGYEFGSFVEAFAFMTKVAMIAERLGHHPEWSNVYGRVEIAITDHDAGGLSTNDRSFVEQVDALS